MNKKGFTLVELLAVIAILAILVIIALPNVMGMFNNAKENSFKTEIKEIYKTAQNQWMQDSMYSTGEVVYSRCSGCTGKSLDLSGRDDLEYYIKVDKSGKVSEFYATDRTFQYSYNEGDLKVEDITSVQKVASLNEDEVLEISSNISVNTRTVYTRTTMQDFNIGDVISSSDYTNDLQGLLSDYYGVFLKFEIDEEDRIKDISQGFEVNNQYYYLKGTASSYNDDKNVLFNVFGTANSEGEPGCIELDNTNGNHVDGDTTIGNKYVYCIKDFIETGGSKYKVTLGENGMISITHYRSGENCYKNLNGTFSCIVGK